jgi:hypothetical protein
MFRLWNARKSGRFAAWLSISTPEKNSTGAARRMKHGGGLMQLGPA